MEKDLQKGRYAVRKRDVVIGLSLGASFLIGLNQAESFGKEPTDYTSYPDEDFKPVVIYENDIKERPSLIPYSNVNVADEGQEKRATSPITKVTEIVEKDIELELVIDKMKSNRELFNKKYIKDVKLYYPIYKAVADKFDMDWYLIWIVHEKETGASAGERGFANDSYYVGAMQRDPNIWTEEFVNEAAEGLKDLAKLPQRHKDDWKEIATGARILDRNIDKYLDDGYSKSKSVLKALLLYSADGPARERFSLYKDVKEVFSS